MDWNTGEQYCNDLDVDGHDDWRLPTICELRSLIEGCDNTMVTGQCGITDGCLSDTCMDWTYCKGCNATEGPADGCWWQSSLEGECMSYWSSSISDEDTYQIYMVRFDLAAVDRRHKQDSKYIRCVR